MEEIKRGTMGRIDEVTDQNMFAPDCSPFLSKAGLNLALGLVAICRLHNGDLYAVGWGKGP